MGHDFSRPASGGPGRVALGQGLDTRNTASTADDVELMIRDSQKPAGQRDMLGMGCLTVVPIKPGSHHPLDLSRYRGGGGGWKTIEGSIYPWAVTFKAMAAIDKVCPTLDPQ